VADPHLIPFTAFLEELFYKFLKFRELFKQNFDRPEHKSGNLDRKGNTGGEKPKKNAAEKNEIHRRAHKGAERDINPQRAVPRSHPEVEQEEKTEKAGNKITDAGPEEIFRFQPDRFQHVINYAENQPA
jgi:hypothetical protein